MGNRKNNGVTMTRQSATSKPYRLGMTQDASMVESYIKAAKEEARKKSDLERNAYAAGDLPDFLQGFHERCFIAVRSNKHYRELKRYSSGERTFFVEEGQTFKRRSVTYPTKQLADLAFTLGRIKWID